MTKTDPKHRAFAELNEAEREYYTYFAEREAERLLERMSGTLEWKALVGANLGKAALKKLPPKPQWDETPRHVANHFGGGNDESN